MVNLKIVNTLINVSQLVLFNNYAKENRELLKIPLVIVGIRVFHKEHDDIKLYM